MEKLRRLREVKPTKRRKRSYTVIRRLSKKDKTRRLKKPYTTKLGRQLKANQIGDTPRVQPLGDN